MLSRLEFAEIMKYFNAKVFRTIKSLNGVEEVHYLFGELEIWQNEQGFIYINGEIPEAIKAYVKESYTAREFTYFMIVYRNYLLQKRGMGQFGATSEEEAFNITKRILSRVNLPRGKNAFSWMRQEAFKRKYNVELACLEGIISKFIEAVNPFSWADFKLEEIPNYLDKVDINVCLEKNQVASEEVSDNYAIVITDLETDNYIRIRAHSDEVDYLASVKGIGGYSPISLEYGFRKNDGEFIEILGNNLHRTFNLTSGKVRKGSSSVENDITEESFDTLYALLYTYTTHALEITNKLKKQEPVKKMGSVI